MRRISGCRDATDVSCLELPATSHNAEWIGVRLFQSTRSRFTYLRLVRENPSETGVELLGWYLMTNHVHLVAKRLFCKGPDSAGDFLCMDGARIGMGI